MTKNFAPLKYPLITQSFTRSAEHLKPSLIMNSQVTLICPTRGNIYQTIDPSNPKTIGELAGIVGEAYNNPTASFFLNSANGNTSPVNRDYRPQVGDTLSVAHQTKAGR